VSDADIERTLRFAPALCATGALVVWTRMPDPPGILDRIEGWLADAGFEPRARVVGTGDLFGVGTARLRGEPPPFRPGEPLFTFVR
jgi:hypothetical protein